MYNRRQKSQQQHEYLLGTIYSSNYNRNFISSLYFLKEESKWKHTEDGAVSYATRNGVQNNSMINSSGKVNSKIFKDQNSQIL